MGFTVENGLSSNDLELGSSNGLVASKSYQNKVGGLRKLYKLVQEYVNTAAVKFLEGCFGTNVFFASHFEFRT